MTLKIFLFCVFLAGVKAINDPLSPLAGTDQLANLDGPGPQSPASTHLSDIGLLRDPSTSQVAVST